MDSNRQAPDAAMMTDGTYFHRLRVRYGETDQMGRVHHANYLLYMEEARTGMMRAMGASYAQMEREGIGLPVRKTDLRYRNAARYEEELVVETSIERVGPASVTFAYRIVRPEESGSSTLIVTGSTELACISMGEGGGLMHLPDKVRASFEGI
ncbi:MAG: thioesterase family protein [Planctomycetota bacterium]|nr:thioesterase family protein [Planctomycetota bacterium]